MSVLTYPGVYIEEFAPGAPIEGVGTSTAAFIGPAASGELDTPTKITSFDQFQATFGKEPLPGFYLWYAVRGFFENTGQVCYVVRASNGDYASINLPDSSAAGNDLIRVRARQPGIPAPVIGAQVALVHVVPNTTALFQPTSALAAAAVGREMTLNAGDGANFKPGDWVTIGTAGERIQLLRVAGDVVRLATDPANAYVAGDAIRLADAPAGTRMVRVHPAAVLLAGTLVPGTMLKITQGAVSTSQIVESVQMEPLAGGIPTYRVTFRTGITVPLSLDPANPAQAESQEFSITITHGTASTLYDRLSIDPAHPRYFADVINGDGGGLVRVDPIEPPPAVAPPDNLPKAGAFVLAGGKDEDLATMADTDYLDALKTLEQKDDVNLVAVPDRINDPVQQEIIAHCERLGDRFAVLDALRPASDQGLFGPGTVEAQRPGLDSTRGYAALYYPWLRVPPFGAGGPILVPPSGHICGVMARCDNQRGVHKAPANEIIAGAVGVERTMSDIDHGQLNLIGVNINRVFKGGGRPMVFGARTTATDRNWQYVNIRRLFIFLEKSIQDGIRWAVFEPNNLQLWQKLRRTITEFLTRAWRDGALFGATPKDAFYVRIDEVLNPFSEQALGRLHIEIGVRPSYPAEFIVVRIGIWPGGSEVSES
jgi:phage tail sheath protein FI